MSDSEDSDGEGGLGNLNRMVMRPPGHSGKAKKGHICFDASFETGNLGRVDLISEFEYDLFIRPDTCCPKIRMWFNFMVDNVKQDQRVIFNFVNFSKNKNLFNYEMTPIVRSTSRPKWQRIVRRNVFYHRSIYHRFRHILSIAFAFDKEEDIYHFAMATPYSYSRLQSYLDSWSKKAKPLGDSVKRTVIGKSIQKRNIDLITIGNEPEFREHQNGKIKREKRRVVFIIARVHGGEPPSSFVCQGLLDFLISSHTIAKCLRQNITIKIIPMLNPDGVHLGNQRTSLLGFDLNRSWHMISQYAHPTLKCAYEVIKETEARKERYQLDFIIDIHAHNSLSGCFIYGNTYDDVYRYERHIVFPKVFAAKAEGYCAENAFFNSDSLKMGTARRHFCTTLSKNTNSFTLQVSMGGYHLPGIKHYIHYNDEAYLRLGRHLGKALYEYYKQINIIIQPIKISESKGSKKKKHKHKRHLKKIPPARLPFKNLQKPQCLEPRIFSPSIIRPKPEVDFYITNDQLPNHGLPSIPKKIASKKSAKLINSFDDGKKPYFGDENYSPPPSLTIIDLNNTIRNGLAQNNSLHLHDESSKNLSKKDIWRQQIAKKRSEVLSSDDD